MPHQNCHKKFPRLLLVWVLLFALKLGYSQSQQEEYILETIPLTGELSGFHGTCMLQDSEGFMWFGSNRSGLCRYDGRSFKMYRHIPGNRNSLVFDIIYQLIEDREGYIWIATWQGLNRFDPSTETFKRYMSNSEISSSFLDTTITYSLLSNTIHYLLEDSQGYIWLGTDMGCSRFDKSTETFENYFLKPDNVFLGNPFFNRVNSLYEDRSGTIWIQNGPNGLSRIEREADSIEFITEFSCRIWKMLEDRSGRFWITTECGLYFFDRDHLIFDKYVDNVTNLNQIEDPDVGEIGEDSQGNIWIRSSEGIFKYNQQLELLFQLPLADQYFEYFQKDQNVVTEGLKNYLSRYISMNQILQDITELFLEDKVDRLSLI